MVQLILNFDSHISQFAFLLSILESSFCINIVSVKTQTTKAGFF